MLVPVLSVIFLATFIRSAFGFCEAVAASVTIVVRSIFPRPLGRMERKEASLQP